EIAYFETCHELKLIVDLIYERGFRGMWHNVSNTAEFGGLTRRGRIITEETEKEMDEILKEIQNGKFAKEWALENRAGAPMLKRMRKLESELEIEEVGSKLRKLCGLEK
ncbi:MAG: ketol-acid reductoisomerase, partial [Methanothermobacter sp.]|nr:ketol-acid reductoisomerase [Methanothermobacter sp.]